MRHRQKHDMRTYVLAGIALSFFCAGGIILWATTLPIPDLESLATRKVAQSTKIYDRTGEIVLYDFHNDVQRTVIPFEDISRNIKNATVAIEDEHFYQHNGIEISSILRAVLVDIITLDFSQGGSTITQQVVKNSILTSDKTIGRKLKEWVLALKLEKVLTKEQILNLYLNEIPYGGNTYGIEEASQRFFGVDASDLTLAQSAYLAGIPQAPTRYSPYGNHRDELENRKNLVLSQMLKNKFITEEEYTSAKNEKVTFLPQVIGNIKAPHFVFFVREYLEEKYGDKVLEEGGLKVVTTLDYDLQAQAEKIVATYGAKNKEDFNASNAALVAIDPKTGQILSLVGSRDYFDQSIDGNFNVALAHRQPGSTFKPFVYATAFKKGYTPSTVVFDVPTQFQTTCAWNNFTSENGCYSPGNFDEKFRGPISLRSAIAESRNVPSVKTLYLAGIKDSIQTATDMGIQSLQGAEQYGLTLVLGGGEVSLLDLTSAYGVFANDGVRNPAVSILSVTDAQGESLEEYTPRPEQALDPLVAEQVNDILSDNNARIPEFGADSPLFIPGRNVAAKTGTTNDFRDVWTVGYTPDLVVGVWGGNNNNTPIKKQIAGFVIAPMWNAFMTYALPKFPGNDFVAPDYSFMQKLKPILRGIWQGGDTYTIDTLSGKLATEYTPLETRKEVSAGGNIHSILFYVNRSDPKGPAPLNPDNDPQFRLWEPAVQKWASEHSLSAGTGPIPTTYDDIHTPANTPSFTFLSPLSGATVDGHAPLTIKIAVSSPFPVTKVEYAVNGLVVGSSTSAPYSFTFTPQSVGTLRPRNTLTATLYDSIANKVTQTTEFSVE